MQYYPNFLVIGAMKCATSTLHEQLALQPGIFMTSLKEPNFFSDNNNYKNGLNWYTSLFNPESSDILYGESSTHYTKLPTYPETISRIKNHIPDTSNLKFIYVMRHPINRLVSQYIHEWSQRNIPKSTDINTAIQRYPELIDYSKYTMQLQPYFENFGRDKIMPVFFERLISNPQPELERICQFLGYPNKPLWHENIEAQNVSSARMRKSEWRDLLVEMPVLSTFRKQVVPQSWRERIKKLWTLTERPQLSNQNLEYLREIFDQDLNTLGDWLNIDGLCCDKFQSIVKSDLVISYFV